MNSNDFLNSNFDYLINPPSSEICELCDGEGINIEKMNELIDLEIEVEALTVEQVKEMSTQDKVRYLRQVLGENVKCKCQ